MNVSTLWFWVKIAVAWFFVDTNRAKALIVLGKIYSVVKFITDKTDFQWDNQSLAFLAKLYYQFTRVLDEPEKQVVAKKITETKGPLKGIDLSYDSKENAVAVGYHGLNLEYSPNDGSVKTWGTVQF